MCTGGGGGGPGAGRAVESPQALTGSVGGQGEPSTQVSEAVQPQSQVPMKLGQRTTPGGWSSSQREKPITNRLQSRRVWILAAGSSELTVRGGSS